MSYLKKIKKLEEKIMGYKAREYLNSVVGPKDDSPEYFNPIIEISKELRRIENGSLPEFYGALTQSERKKYDPKGLLLKEVEKILKHRNRKN